MNKLMAVASLVIKAVNRETRVEVHVTVTEPLFCKLVDPDSPSSEVGVLLRRVEVLQDHRIGTVFKLGAFSLFVKCACG